MRCEISEHSHKKKNGMETRERSLLEPERDRSDLVDTEKQGFVRACPGHFLGCWGLLAMIYDTSRVR